MGRSDVKKDHLYYELAEARRRGRPLDPGELPPGCTCYECTGIMPPEVDYDSGPKEFAKSIPIEDVAKALGSQLEERYGKIKGTCPIHNDNNPSMNVNVKKNLWYCFACAEGGDGLQLVMSARGLDFPGAIDYLCSRFGYTGDPTRE